MIFFWIWLGGLIPFYTVTRTVVKVLRLQLRSTKTTVTLVTLAWPAFIAYIVWIAWTGKR